MVMLRLRPLVTPRERRSRQQSRLAFEVSAGVVVPVLAASSQTLTRKGRPF
jgi:hypothetical protein